MQPIQVRHERIDRLEPHPRLSHPEHILTLQTNGHLKLQQTQGIAGALTFLPTDKAYQRVSGQPLEVGGIAFNCNSLGINEQHPLMLPFQQVRQSALPVCQLPAARKDYFLLRIKELALEFKLPTPESKDIARSLLLLLLGEAKAPKLLS